MKSEVSISISRALTFSLLLHMAFFGAAVLFVVQLHDRGEKDYIDVNLIQPSRGRCRAPASTGPRRETTIAEARHRPPSGEQDELSETGKELVQKVQAPAPAGPLSAQSEVPSSGDPPGSSYGGSEYLPFHRVSIIPRFNVRSQPVYPSSERAAGAEARVIVEVYINRAGRVDDVKVVKSGGRLFDHAVLEAVRSSSFQPGYLDGRPVPVRVQIPYSFKLR